MAQISGTFNGVSDGTSLQISQGQTVLYFCIHGLFEGIIYLECSNDGGSTWKKIKNIIHPLDGRQPVQSGLVFRFACTSLTSGSVSYELDDDSNIERTFFSSSGQKVLQILDDGINVIGKIKHNGIAVHE